MACAQCAVFLFKTRISFEALDQSQVLKGFINGCQYNKMLLVNIMRYNKYIRVNHSLVYMLYM